jgi:hypothetical protein
MEEFGNEHFFRWLENERSPESFDTAKHDYESRLPDQIMAHSGAGQLDELIRLN